MFYEFSDVFCHSTCCNCNINGVKQNSMASFNRPRFPAPPMFNQNILNPGFNMKFRGERPPMPTFQRAPGPHFRPFQSPDRFPRGSFQNRPRFSNFPDPAFSHGFRNRPPAPDKMPPINAPHLGMRPRFSGPFEPPFRPWNQRPAFAPPRQPFQNRPRPSVSPLKSRNTSVQANKKRNKKTREFRKLKDNNKEKPFSCDTCDRAFVTENELNEHISQHIKCEMPNCIFEAHPKIVALHQKMQHETGYADVINKLKDSEEIKKWREERRKNFPTAENVQKRKAEKAEKEARGEVLETKEFGKFKRRRPEDGSLRNNNDHRRKRVRNFQNNPGRESLQNHPFSKPFIFHIDPESDSDSDSHIALKQFSGLSSLTNSASVNKEDSSIDVGPSSCIEDNITSNVHLSACNQNNHDLPIVDLDANLTVKSVLHINSNANNVKDLDKSSVLFSNNSVERKISEEITDSLHAVGNNTSSKDIEIIEELPKDRDITDPEGIEIIEELPKDRDISDPEGIEIIEELPEVGDITDPEDYKASEKLPELPEGPKNVLDVEDSEDEAPIAVPIVKSRVNEIPEEHNSTDDKCVNKMKKIVKSDKRQAETSSRPCEVNTSNKKLKKESASGDSSHNYANSKNNSKHKWPEPLSNIRKSTLLEKLLADDIRHERNVALQCIRHIVNNNFFGIGQK